MSDVVKHCCLLHDTKLQSLQLCIDKVFLQCGHSLCASCLIRSTDEAGIIACPYSNCSLVNSNNLESYLSICSGDRLRQFSLILYEHFKESGNLLDHSKENDNKDNNGIL